MKRYKNGDEFYDNNIIFDEEKHVLYNKEENIKKSEFKDYAKLRKYLIENPRRSIKYDDKMEIRPSCVERLDALVQAYDRDKPVEEMTIENWNYMIEQQIIIWRGGF
ncbi:hypothetical protein [Brachyspira aalborgi]|uniref:hypothetical protein n=1 Tax=Brachyspira aalborgi TaxID=29522 RepID=UPI0026667498|nr:hypothetical protein [Brachyspira aalborgi]